MQVRGYLLGVLTTVLVGCHMAHYTPAIVAGPVAASGPQPVAVVSVQMRTDPRGNPGPTRMLGLRLDTGQVIPTPLTDLPLRALARVAAQAQAHHPDTWIAFGGRVVAIDASGVSEIGDDAQATRLAAFDPFTACAAGSNPSVLVSPVACVAPGGARLAVIRQVDSSCGSSLQILQLAASGTKLGADTVAPLGTSSRLDSCAAHADGGVLVAGAQLISISPGAPLSLRANARHVRVAPIASGYAVYADATDTAGDLELVDRTLTTTGRVSLPVQKLYDPSALTSDGTNALVLRVHHATVTVTRVDARGTTLGTTVLELDAYVPPAMK